MSGSTLSYRAASEADSDFLFALRNDPDVRAASRNTEPLDRATHDRWVAETLASDERVLYVVERDGEPVGTVRFDIRGSEGEVSILLMPDARGGIGWRALTEGTQVFLASHDEVTRVIGEVRNQNDACLGLARRTGYRLTEETRTPGFVIVAYERDQAPLEGETIDTRA